MPHGGLPVRYCIPLTHSLFCGMCWSGVVTNPVTTAPSLGNGRTHVGSTGPIYHPFIALFLLYIGYVYQSILGASRWRI